MKTFSGRVAAVTGAGSGIGQALAVELAKRGCAVALADKNLDALKLTQELVYDNDGRCSVHALDVSDRDAVTQFANDVNKRYGEVHLLFNNAGVTLVDTIENQSIEDMQWLMGINYWGVVHCTQAFLPYMRQAPEAHIINVSSIFGMLAVPGQSAYNSSKFAVRGYTEALRHENLGTSLKVTCVLPGGVKTGIMTSSRIKIDRLGSSQSKEEMIRNFNTKVKTTPEQAALRILKGVERDEPRVVIGWDAKLMDLVTRLFPRSYDRILGFRRRFEHQSTIATANRGASNTT
ncbi:SDR family NAD(P)-dependent oxidoreductase [Pseudomaricurvus alkylphenolicus]|uniref:SDR family NAD(P)-dependent oxidoreductase n=1 Tax=Pseudomaricurvus alkylphenolicus TaxID=1306991 RepID=UPI00142405D2|nr:SDR family NAD(P)-dependent oxidoreductase [Pseudomaricurvus alkylphenolicus]NIB38702.1 SDR family NAD(P)-dependent oxidoreductase [Pseudomaricurvus alkylphenolicus]